MSVMKGPLSASEKFVPRRVRSIKNANMHCKPSNRLIFSIPDRG